MACSDENSYLQQPGVYKNDSRSLREKVRARVTVSNRQLGLLLRENSALEVRGTTITVNAIKLGETTIDVKDSENRTASLMVKVVPEDLALEKNVATVLYGTTTTVKITAGSCEYTATSADDQMATAIIDKGKVIITGRKIGTTTIEVTDKLSSKKKTIKVTIERNPDALKLDKTELPLQVGKSGTVTILKGGVEVVTAKVKPHTAADATRKANVITVAAKEAGKATLVVTDGLTTLEVQLNITGEHANIDVDHKVVEIQAGANASVTITKGSGNYGIKELPKAEVATAKLENAILTITAVAEGDTKVVLVDNDTQKTVTFSIKVTPKPMVIEDLEIEAGKEQLYLYKGQSAVSVNITKGSGEYELTGFDSNVITVTRTGSVITITPVAKGTTTITVSDTKKPEPSNKKTITVDVYEPMTLSTKTVTIEKGQEESVTISGGSGEFSAVSNKGHEATPQKSGSTVRIIGNAPCSAVVTVTDSKTKQELTISVQVTANSVRLASEKPTVGVGEQITINVYNWVGELKVSDVKISPDGTATFVIVGGVPIGLDPASEWGIKLTGAKAGKVTVTVHDPESGNDVTCEITVEDKAKELRIREPIPSPWKIAVGGTQVVKIFSGNGGYKFTGFSTDALDVTVKTVSGQDQIVIKGLKAGTYTITVTDAKG